jgi:Fe-S-cluster containining protein
MSDTCESKRQSNFFDVCSKCKTGYSCCFGTRPPITTERRKIIEAYLKESGIYVKHPFTEEGYVFPSEQADGYCVFHDKETRKCRIHAVKPETCVAGPITFDINRRSGKVEWFIKMDKICPLAGVVYDDKRLLQKHAESAKRELWKLIGGLGSEALKAILDKDEPETFKIGEDDAVKDIMDKLN